MLRGLYNAAAGMVTQQRRHDTVTQNIANLNTAGYKQNDTVIRSFPEVLVSMIGGEPGNPKHTIGKLNTGVFAEESMALYTQGDLRETGNTSDFAIVSELNVMNPETGMNMPFDASGRFISEDGEVTYRPQAFFTVQDENGNTRYTRNGQFQISPEGNVLTSTGLQVLDTNNEAVVLTGAAGNLTVNEQGFILDGAGNPIGPALGISVVDRPFDLVREGNGVYRLQSEEGVRMLANGDNVMVRQGFIEASNVDPSKSMVELTAALRAYETNQKVIQFYDKSLEKAANEIGRV
ncbi:flagellar hook-basal body protein [Paenibacillus lemnae]|uniref:Flagellar hook-basal body protein n=1 Tax=Paenibacillus lemnae TaxID=1330551 RepID=A0A848MD92_PAELE|nr:flagellar hook-basal body protein [Paenibacillus lemnae]NMO98161.1 flagellar hook-basal body protein [Paenibacillus lemnae]